MELRHLRYLIAVADAGTFVRAAEVLRVAQPALSRQINDLERELKVDLFEDGARKATLTDAGRAAVRIARHVVDETERAVARARMSDQGLLGTCMLTSGPVPLRMGIVAQLVARLQKRHPSITINVREGAFPLQWKEVAESEIDIGLGAAPPHAFQGLSVETQLTLPVDIALLSPDHPLSTRESIRLADLGSTRYLALEDSAPDTDLVRDMMLREMDRQKLDFGSPRFFPSLESLLIHVRAGQGWTLMPRVFADALAPLRGPRIEDFQAPFRITRFWRRADKRPVTRTVLNELRALQQEGLEAKIAMRDPSQSDEPREFVPVRLDLRHLRSFVEVAEVGSLGRAAESLDITQPALSRQMRELEYDVGVPLLERGTRGVELTSAGEAFRSDARGLLGVVNRLPAEVRRAKRGADERRCVIGTVAHPLIEALLARIVTDLENRTPRVRVGSRALVASGLPNLVQQSELDIAIGFLHPARIPATDNLAHVTLIHDQVSYALLQRGHPLAERVSISLRELQDVPLIFPSRESAPPWYDVVMHHFDAAGARPRVHMEYEGVNMIATMVAQGVGWALGFRSYVGHEPLGTVLVPLSDFELPWSVALVYRKDESRDAILTTIEAIVGTARQMFSDGVSAPATTPSTLNTSQTAIS